MFGRHFSLLSDALIITGEQREDKHLTFQITCLPASISHILLENPGIYNHKADSAANTFVQVLLDMSKRPEIIKFDEVPSYEPEVAK